MKQEHFDKFQHAADPRLLEEAQEPLRRQAHSRAPLALAACLCVVIAAAAVVWQPWNAAQPQPTADSPVDAQSVEGSAKAAQIPNPLQEETAESIAAMGYALPVPAEAQDVAYTSIASGDAENAADAAVRMAQADYTVDGRSYTCRALKGAQGADLSGLYMDWTQTLSWTADGMELTLRSNDDYAVAAWYLPETDTQYSLSGETDAQTVLAQAQQAAMDLGHSLATAPAGAQDVTVNAFEYNGMTIAETAFTMDGAQWVYRTAATGEVSIIDISGMEQTFTAHAVAQVSYCDAELSFDEGGAGKILWLDVAPGLAYSLSVDSGASEQLLTDMANAIFAPVQGDVG